MGLLLGIRGNMKWKYTAPGNHLATRMEDSSENEVRKKKQSQNWREKIRKLITFFGVLYPATSESRP